MPANIALLIQTYRRAIEARQRYVVAMSVAKLTVDSKVDHALIKGIDAAKDALESAGGHDSSWFLVLGRDVARQVDAELRP